MSTTPIVSLSGRVDVHRLDELRALGPHPMIDASGIEFLDLHALSVLYELGAIVFAPSDVVRLTIELTNSPVASVPTLGAAISTLVGAE